MQDRSAPLSFVFLLFFNPIKNIKKSCVPTCRQSMRIFYVVQIADNFFFD